MVDRSSIFEECLSLLREEKIDAAAFLARIGEYLGLVPIVGERCGAKFNVVMLSGDDPDKTFFPIFSSPERFAASVLSRHHQALLLPLDTIVRQIQLSVGIAMNPGTDFSYDFSPFILQKHIRTFGADTVLEEVTPEWLSNINDEFSRDEVPHSQRTWRAMAEWSKRNNTSLAYDSWRCELMTTWFAAHIKPGADHIGLLAKPVYFFDATFWPVEIPFIFGELEDNPCNRLSMPASVRMRFMADRNELYIYLKFWADCIDYYYGILDVRDPATLNNALLYSLVMASREQLTTAALLLLEQRPNPKAAEAAALGLEIVLKAFLVAKHGLNEEALKKNYRHNLSKLLNACIAVRTPSPFLFIEPKLSLFPDISSRYSVRDVPWRDLWTTYYCAQTAGGALLREMTSRNTALGINVD